MNIKEAKNLTINMMVRDEIQTVFYALLSVLPGAARAIVVDTGSTDGTLELLRQIRDQFPEKVELHEIRLPNSSSWAFGKYTRPNKALGDLRSWMVRQVRTEFMWLVDGDEVYRDSTVNDITKLVQDFPADKNVAFVPLLWFAQDIDHLGVCNPETYPYTGRIFRTEGHVVTGEFPGEMATYNNQIVLHESPCSFTCTKMAPFHHYEMIGKPWRRRIISLRKYNGPQPEVFARYGTIDCG